MMRVARAQLVAALLTGIVLTYVPAEAQSNAQIPAGSRMEVVVIKSLDAKKNKVGDEVVAKVARDLKVGDSVVIAKNSKLLGHLTDVKPKSKDQPQSLITIAFERAQLKDGTEIPLSALIQALAKPVDDRSGEIGDLMRGTSANQTLSGTADKAVGVGGKVGEAAEVLTINTQGVLGYNGIAVQGSTVFSNQNVHLDGGTSMILQVSGK